MICKLKICDNEIPKSRKKSATYCSDECYYAAKKERSCLRYATLNGPAKEIKRNESILAFLYCVFLLKKPISADDLETYKFDFSLSTGEHSDDKKGICKILGKYVYHIGSDKTLTIWKLKQRQ